MKYRMTQAVATTAVFSLAVLGVQLLSPVAHQATAAEGQPVPIPGQPQQPDQPQAQEGQEQKDQDQSQNQSKDQGQDKQQQDQQGDQPAQQPDGQLEQPQPEDFQQREPGMQTEQAPAPEAAEDYRYTAQAGDSYTLMARKALQTYGINNNVDLSLAEIVMAETNMTIQAGQPLLTVGQQVTVPASLVNKWVQQAQAMNAAQEAAWQHYVPGVNFNTNKVGEA